MSAVGIRPRSCGCPNGLAHLSTCPKLAAVRAAHPERPRAFKVMPGRRWTRVAERLGADEVNAQHTARWFLDTHTGTWYVAESWKRPNLGRPLNAQQAAYVERQLEGLI